MWTFSAHFHLNCSCLQCRVDIYNSLDCIHLTNGMYAGDTSLKFLHRFQISPQIFGNSFCHGDYFVPGMFS